MMHPEKRKPILAGTGSLDIGKAGSTSKPENSQSLIDIQADRIWRRFRVSQHVARAVAEHAFGWRPA